MHAGAKSNGQSSGPLLSFPVHSCLSPLSYAHSSQDVLCVVLPARLPIERLTVENAPATSSNKCNQHFLRIPVSLAVQERAPLPSTQVEYDKQQIRRRHPKNNRVMYHGPQQRISNPETEDHVRCKTPPKIRSVTATHDCEELPPHPPPSVTPPYAGSCATYDFLTPITGLLHMDRDDTHVRRIQDVHRRNRYPRKRRVNDPP